MPDKKGNLYLFEAIELRNEYDRHIKLIEKLTGVEYSKSKEIRFLRDGDDEEKEPAAGFERKVFEEKLKKLQTKRIKLNQAIQIANFETEIEYNGEKISISEALDVRKSLISDHEAISRRVAESAYKRIIHKEERDIVREPEHAFKDTYEDFQNNLKKLRQLINQIHIANHQAVVQFKDE